MFSIGSNISNYNRTKWSYALTIIKSTFISQNLKLKSKNIFQNYSLVELEQTIPCTDMYNLYRIKPNEFSQGHYIKESS